MTAPAPSQMPYFLNKLFITPDTFKKKSYKVYFIYSQCALTDAEPAVTTPSFLKTVGNFPNVSRVVFGFGCSSISTLTSALFTFIVTGASSALNTLLSCAKKCLNSVFIAHWISLKLNNVI